MFNKRNLIKLLVGCFIVITYIVMPIIATPSFLRTNNVNVNYPQWTNTITRDINRLRNEYNLSPIIYNYTLHDKLIEITNSTWPGMWYEWNLDFCMNFPFSRVNCNRGYSLHPLGSIALLHDTILKPDRIKLIIKQRIAQKKCLLNACVNNDWITCFKDPSYENLFSPSACIFSHHYILKFLLIDLKYIACTTLRFETNYSPIDQNYSFWCYSNSMWFSQDSNLIKINKW